MAAQRATAPDSLILAVACGAQFVVVLDFSIVNVALPQIRTELGASPAGLQWVINYLNGCWILFVNVPIGVLVTVAVNESTPRHEPVLRAR